VLTGELPLGKFQPPSRKVQVDVRLDEVVLHALEKEPERRYQHAGEVKTDVETIVEDAANSAVARPRTESTAGGAPRLSWMAIWAAVSGNRKGLVWRLSSFLAIIGMVVIAWMTPIHPSKKQLSTPAVLTAPIPAVPPVVIATIPESGDSQVEPSLTEVRVTFSKPMQDGSRVWTNQGGERFPEMAGRPQFLPGGRTCVLPVRLQPGSVYAIWFNSESQHDLKDQQGRAAVPYLLIFETKNRPWNRKPIMKARNIIYATATLAWGAEIGLAADALLQSAPPVVVKTVPVAGATDVDPRHQAVVARANGASRKCRSYAKGLVLTPGWEDL
jgi:hypothetical protein